MILQDIRHGLRSLFRNPILSAIAIFTIAVGIGATTTIFSVVKAVLLSPLPYHEPNRLVRVYGSKLSEGIERSGMSGADFVDFRDELNSFEHLGAYRWFGLALTGMERPRELATILATPGLIAELEEPLLGRTFLPEEGEPGKGNVVLLSAALWKSEFGGKTDIVGQTVLLDNEQYMIVGVMPERFAFPAPDIEIWAPWTFDPAEVRRDRHWWNVLGRLSEEASLDAANAEIKTFMASLEDQYPESNEGWSAFGLPLHEQVVGSIRPALMTLMLAVLLVLFIACANVANLLLARGVARQQEVALRAALGAGRRKIVRGLMIESLILAVAGGILGVVSAYVSVKVLIRLAPEGLPRLGEIGIDLQVLAFSFVLTLISGVVFGLVPALRISRHELADSLRDGGRGSHGALGGLRLRNSIAVVQIALSLVLLVGAGLLLRSFLNLVDTDPGFRPEKRLALQLFVYGDKYEDPENQRQFYERLFEEIKAVPGVRSVAGVSALPLSPISGGSVPIRIVGRAEPESEQAGYRIATRGYFETMGVRLVRGRVFDASDHRSSAPVAILNETAARRYFPAGGAIGAFVEGRDEEAVEIVGVVSDVRQQGIDQDPSAEILVPFQQNVTGTMSVIVETEVEPEPLTRTVQDRVWRVDPAQPIWDTLTLETLIEEDMAQERFHSFLVGLFAMTALILAAVGLYGVVSYSVVQRTQEIGLRMAIGARSSDILGLVLRNGSLLISAGLAAGLLLALGLTVLFSRLLTPLLFQVSPTDPPTFVGVSILMAVVALIACLVPARRASRVDPIRALHYE